MSREEWQQIKVELRKQANESRASLFGLLGPSRKDWQKACDETVREREALGFD